MNTPLHRLYRTKLTLLAVVATMAGLALLVLSALTQTDETWGWLDRLPVNDIGSALLTTGLIAVFFEFLDRKDAEERASQQLRTILREEAPAIRDAVVDGFAFAPESLTGVASPETLDRVVQNCLGLRLGDKELANDVYADLREQVVQAGGRCYDVKVSVVLAPWDGLPAEHPDAMFVATIRWEYKVEPLSPAMRFVCVSTDEDYQARLRDPTTTSTWRFQPAAGLDASSSEVFSLVQLSVDGKEQKIQRSTRAGAQIYTVQTGGSPSDGRVPIAYTLRLLVRRNGNLFHLHVARPTKGLSIEIIYTGCGLENMRVLDYIASAKQPRISQLVGPQASMASIGFDGWVWPKGGVNFVWSTPSPNAAPGTGGRVEPTRREPKADAPA